MTPFAETSSATPWIALLVRPRLERSAQAGLANCGIETFVAWHGVPRRWSDRVKTIERNLIPGYVFCRSAFADRVVVMRQPGVEGVVSFDRKPATIPDHEIDSLRRAIDSKLPIGAWPFLKSGERVRIECGALAGFEGTLVRDAAACRVVVSVEALQRSVAVEVDREWIRPIPAHQRIGPVAAGAVLIGGLRYGRR